MLFTCCRPFFRHGTKQISKAYIGVAVLITPFLLYILFISNYNTPPIMTVTYNTISTDYANNGQNHIQLVNTVRNSDLDTNSDKPSSGCIIPKLYVNDPDIMQFFKTFPPISCGDGFDWVSVRQGKFSITPEARKRYGNDVQCSLTPLVKVTDFKTEEKLPPLTDVKDGSDLIHDFYKVECQAKNGAETYRNYHAGIHRKPEVVDRIATKSSNNNTNNLSLDLDVIILGQDSLSHMAWLRHLPLTRKYLVKELKAIEMEGQTVVGDGTPATMFPLLTGHREEELPEARRGYPGAKPVDRFPWIWDQFQNSGYVTSWLEDQPSIGTFHYRLMGFDKDPVDHYYRPFGLYSEKYFNQFQPHCIGAKPRIAAENDYLTDVFDVYKGQGQRKWTMNFLSENSHDNNNHASKLDVHMRDHLKELQDKGHLDNAMLIVFADHGARFSNIRAFAQGKQEERMPYLAIRLPEWFHVKHPDIVKNLKTNSQRLTTPFDLHETLEEILHYTGSGPADISNRGVSLFKEIPIERDCKSADVDPHWCFCLDWSPVPKDSDVIRQAVSHLLNTINGVTQNDRDKCALLEVMTVKSAMEMKVKEDVLKFKDTADGGRGRFGKMDDRTKHSRIIYQITFVTQPGNGLFEATLSRDMKTKKIETSLKSISRINKYGSAPWCIMESTPQLRPYCTCKQPPPPSFKGH